jgi:hypothetical protein
MVKKTARPRTARREADRAGAALVRTRDRIAQLEPGGSPDWPIALESAVLVERRAASIPCPRCAGPVTVITHDARATTDARRREVIARCQRCSHARSVWFVITPAERN